MAREAAPDEPSQAKKCQGLEPDEKARPGPGHRVDSGPTCALIGRGPIPVVRELLLFGPIGSIAGWRSFEILFINDAE
jgi:hypothetical protein